MTEPSEAAATVLSDEELLKDALLRGIDLRDYATTIETELKDVVKHCLCLVFPLRSCPRHCLCLADFQERASIDDYLREDENLKNLCAAAPAPASLYSHIFCRRPVAAC